MAAFTRVEATIVSGGLMFEMKGQPQDPTPRRMAVALQREWARCTPSAPTTRRPISHLPGSRSKSSTAAVVAERMNPGVLPATPHTAWNPLQRAYFNGYALWTYLTSPFLSALPGFAVRELDPIEENSVKLTGLQLRFRTGFVSHSTLQEFYFGPDLLLARHDYRVDIAGSCSAIQYISDFVNADGIMMPTKRRAYRCGEDGRPMFDQLMVSIDLFDYHFS